MFPFGNYVGASPLILIMKRRLANMIPVPDSITKNKLNKTCCGQVRSFNTPPQLQGRFGVNRIM